MTNTDLRNCHRGKCSCGKCEEFFLPNWEDLSNNGWCLYCNHPLVEHELLRKPELTVSASQVSLLPVAESIGSTSGETSNNFSPRHETPVVEMFLFETQVDSLMSSVKSSQRPIKYFSLPDFSNVLQPLLNGDALSEKDHARLSSILKEELISFPES
ncbi:hypothetical protein AVEN_144160-1 [Araneus ventricosus]|uniref:Uncharacterized protein n=1 Tax=Araneus ventricosus TaxID=182803 RepID=A0A4Y2GFE1_ARAVE|nr:hypothetical protein AVEN_144160-1 [Araneus ventricosus]